MRPKGEVKEMSVVWGNWNDEQNQFHVTTENGIMRQGTDVVSGRKTRIETEK